MASNDTDVEIIGNCPQLRDQVGSVLTFLTCFRVVPASKIEWCTYYFD